MEDYEELEIMLKDIIKPTNFFKDLDDVCNFFKESSEETIKDAIKEFEKDE